MKTSREEGSQQWRVDEEVASPNSEMCLMRAEEKEMIMRGFSSAAKSGDMRPLHDLGESSKVESEKVSQVATTSTAPVSKEHHHNIQTNYSNKLTKPEKQSPTDGDIKQTPTSPKSPLSTPPSASKYSSSSTRSNSFRHYSTTVSTPRRSSLTQSHSNISTDASSGNIQAACISKSSASTLPSSKTPKAVTSPKDSSINSSSGRRKSFNSLQLSWRDTKVALKENLATSFSNSRYSSSFHAKDNSCNETTNFSNTSPEDTFFTPNNYWNVNNDTDSSFDDMVLPGSPIQGQVSYNQMIACIEQENDLDSVDTYKSDDTLPQEGIYWDNSDILLRTGLLLREPALSPATEYLMNSNYMKLKLNSPRTLATLMKQIEIAPPTERLPHSPIAKSARSFMLEKKRESQRRKSMPSISISSLPPVHFAATKPTTPSFEKEETKEIREEHKKTKKELERKKSLKLNEFRSIQRMYYKEELEMSREQEIAQSEMFKKQKIKEWKKKTISSPFKVDLEAHAKQTEKQIRKKEKLQERLRIIELKKKEDLRKCALIEKILENNVENVHMTKRNHIDEQKLQKWRMELSEINHL